LGEFYVHSPVLKKLELWGSDHIQTVISIYRNENLLTSEPIVERSFQILMQAVPLGGRWWGEEADKIMFSFVSFAGYPVSYFYVYFVLQFSNLPHAYNINSQ
jgi:hypothetical protein